jgi:hypothetical protein
MIKFRLILIATLIFTSCKKNIDKISISSWNPNIALPIGEASFAISDLLVNLDSGIVVNDLGEMSISFEENLDTIFAKDFITLDDYTEVYDITPSNLTPTGSFAIGNTLTSSFLNQVTSYTAPNGVILNDLSLESGVLELNLSSTFQHDATLTVKVTDLKKNNSSVVEVINLSYNGNLPLEGTRQVDLTNAIADFTAGGNYTNALRLDIDATITGTGNPIVGNETVSFSFALKNLEYKKITGFFGQESLTSATDTLLIKLFQNAESLGDLSFSNPSLKFKIENSFGIPINLNFDNLKSIDSTSGQSTNMIMNNSSIDISSPSSEGQTSLTEILINRTNTTNMGTLINVKPRYLVYDINAMTNPLGNVGPLNFIESTSKLIVSAELDLPFEGKAFGLQLKDTMDYSFDGEIEQVESVMLRFAIDNGFPIGLTAQLTFVDENYNPIFTLFENPKSVIKGAPVNNSTGKVLNSISDIVDVTLSNDKIKLLKNVHYIIVNGEVGTTDYENNTNVKFYDSYKIGLKLGIQVKIKK